MHKNRNYKDEIIENIYLISVKIKLIFAKALIKSMMLSTNEGKEELFYFHLIYDYKDLYNFLSEEEFFSEFTIKRILRLDDEAREKVSSFKDFLENEKIACVILFQMHLTFSYFIEKVEKITANLNHFFYCLDNKEIRLSEENIIIKDFYSINALLDQLNTKMLLNIKLFIDKISLLFDKDENSCANKLKNFESINNNDDNKEFNIPQSNKVFTYFYFWLYQTL